MRKHSFLFVLLAIILTSGCKQKRLSGPDLTNPEVISLTEEEKAGGVMTPEILWKFGRLGSIELSPDGRSVLYTVTYIDLQTESRRTNIFKIPSSGGEPMQLTTEGGKSPQWIKGGKLIAFIDNNGKLCTMSADGSDRKIIEGLSDFEIFSFSPSANEIFFTRRVKIDQTANEKYGLPKARVRIIDDLMYRHWNTWSDYSYSHIFTGRFNGSKITDIRDIMDGQRFESPLSPDFDQKEIAWSPDGKFLAYTTKRLQGKDYARSTNSDIILHELATGREINITDENKGYDRYPVFSPDGSMIAWQSMQSDGYESDLGRLFVYSLKDGASKWITEKWDFDAENITWAGNSTICFTSAHLGTTQIFKVNASGGEVSKITSGVHDLGPLNISGNVIISGIVSMSMAPEIAAVDIASGKIKQISFINREIYESVKMGKVEERYIKTSDKKDLQMWVIYPPGFDPSKKYPAILYCKGGPQGPLGQSWSYRWNYQMMASEGYIVIAPGRRGTSGFGQKWKEQISGDYGGANIRDYLDASDAMAGEPFVDADRMAAVGASYGGFSVFYLAGVHNGRFKTFISHCGMFNFASWYGTTEELWFPDKDIEGPYWNNPQSYNFSPHLLVEKWDTPILIITGANDFRIPYTQSLEAFQAAQLHGIPSRLLFFEDETHFVSKPQNSVIWHKEFFGWLEKYLK
jgi:dipeptidyl aminopeptidase/acylaminoacyl peptidase